MIYLNICLIYVYLGQIYKCCSDIYIRARYVNMGQIYISETDLYTWV